MLASEHFNPIYGAYDALKDIKGSPFEMDIFLRATREGSFSLESQGNTFSLFRERLQRASTYLLPSDLRQPATKHFLYRLSKTRVGTPLGLIFYTVCT